MWWILATAVAAQPMGVVELDPPTLTGDELADVIVHAPFSEVTPDLRVWNGEELSATEYEATVALFAASNRYYGGVFCSGTLIHPRWVLTAAHCLDGAEQYTNSGLNLYVGTGARDTTGGGLGFTQLQPWIAYELHPSYNPRAGAGAGQDIGLIQLAEPITGVQTIPLNTTNISSDWVGTQLTYVGWGVTRDGGQDSGRKRKTQLPIIDRSADMIYGYNGSNNPWLGGGANSTSNLCQGDSGGSTYAEDGNGDLVVVGVNAIVFPSCVNGGAGSTRVDTYASWITQTLAAEGDTPGESAEDVGGASSNLPDYALDESEKGPIEAPAREAASRPGSGCAVAPSSAGWLVLGAVGLLSRRRRS